MRNTYDAGERVEFFGGDGQVKHGKVLRASRQSSLDYDVLLDPEYWIRDAQGNVYEISCVPVEELEPEEEEVLGGLLEDVEDFRRELELEVHPDFRD